MSHQKFKDCIDACSECAVECSHCESECLNEQDVKMLARCIKLDHDCAAICLFAMQAMASGSEFTEKICKLCAEICTACAEECEKHAHMEHCKNCAESCRKCAVECSNMSKLSTVK
ncbi:MAG: four-helix bundle copper-binding protein [Flavobacterium sp.]|jgi:hypothetical protein|uniref:Four-helix bundle copper-binding protein n=3 Tax=Flavobacterium TaxID=237 RepID=A0A4R5ARW2_9FLAO|nr:MULTISPECIES: four-helix bundle copper-binding protein [Flavobacterium]OYX83588.1 MAG: four-helix bundle copper-binding protein [Flavobacteriales bacterium 32-34-25]MBB1193776.1 four-helix bundle copper-binding protein [Flavobacterium sp. SOK18b]MBC5864269.1 four-helix bundle copper-binding protein [Flavobacterium turcicum]MDP3682087.1 four-helix bundle copper-binding protein [Flavobacterium sp.]MDZ4331364.1 four-helix bundle copper-binding protein [Flavobacterium sp.]